ncbi:hypothetical protein EIP86_009185 [Pleurotus ostreatoroseus]|nr:hypothetical protein EIP86_009185 [Pleurotus ostreatoroseus]
MTADSDSPVGETTANINPYNPTLSGSNMEFNTQQPGNINLELGTCSVDAFPEKTAYLVFQNLGPRQHNFLGGAPVSDRPDTTVTVGLDIYRRVRRLTTISQGVGTYPNMAVAPGQVWMQEFGLGRSTEPQCENNGIATTRHDAAVAFTGPSLANNHGLEFRRYDLVDGAPAYYHQNTTITGIGTYPSTHSVSAHSGLPEIGSGSPMESQFSQSTQRQHPDPPAATHPPKLRKFRQNAYSPKNRRSGFEGVPTIEFNMEDGSKGMPLAAVGNCEFTGLVGRDDLVFESLVPLPEKMGYRLQVGLHRGILLDPVMNAHISLKTANRPIPFTRISAAFLVDNELASLFSEDELSRLVLLKVKHVTKGTLQPILAFAD